MPLYKTNQIPQPHPPLFVLGHARARTSMVTGILVRLGFFGGEMVPPTDANPRGINEHHKIRELWTKPYLRTIKADPLGQYPLPTFDDLREPVPDPSKVFYRMLLSEGYSGGPWVAKDAKFTLIWPALAYCFPNAIWLICRRPRQEVINSMSRQNATIDLQVNLEDWYDHYDQSLDVLSREKPGSLVLTVNTSAIAREPTGSEFKGLVTLARSAGCNPTDADIENATAYIATSCGAYNESQ